MNVRKPIDYSTLYATLDELVAADLPQMELYCGIGRLVSGRPEKGAAVAAAEYLQSSYPDTAGFSPRNLRRMRDFYRTYESDSKIIADAMAIGWTQNIVILEAELTLQEKSWYIRAVQRFGWSKLELTEQIAVSAHLEVALGLPEEVCYTGKNSISLYLPDEAQAGRTWHQLRRESGAAVHQHQLRQVRPPDCDGPGQPAEYVPHLLQRSRWQDAFAAGLYRPPRRCGRPLEALLKTPVHASGSFDPKYTAMQPISYHAFGRDRCPTFLSCCRAFPVPRDNMQRRPCER